MTGVQTCALPIYLAATKTGAGENGYEGSEPWNWPEEVRQQVRDRFATEIDEQRLDPRDYRRSFAPPSGDLDYTPPVPPSLDTIPEGVGDNTYRFSVPAPLVEVIDGDTVTLTFDAGTDLARLTGTGQAQRIRLVGINAAEVNTAQAADYAAQGLPTPWDEQTARLEQIINAATTVDFVVFDTERFPTIQDVEGDEVRWLMVLYVDGVPLWDDGVFSFDAPTGSAVGGQGVPVDLYERLTR